MPSHLEPQPLPTAVAENQKGEQALESERWNYTHIDGGDPRSVVVKEGLPGLRRWPMPTLQAFGDR
jgi:hypothetical protein